MMQTKRVKINKIKKAKKMKKIKIKEKEIEIVDLN